MDKEKFVIDTNILLVSISERSPHHWLFQALLNKEFILCVSNEILSEYAEIIERFMGAQASLSTLAVLTNLPNIELINTYYNFNLLNDKDDNKFVDCAIACNASYLVTNDKDFNILKQIDFPKVNLINLEGFEKIIKKV